MAQKCRFHWTDPKDAAQKCTYLDCDYLDFAYLDCWYWTCGSLGNLVVGIGSSRLSLSKPSALRSAVWVHRGSELA